MPVINHKQYKIVWFGGFPAHYMAAFHSRLEREYQDIYFVYVPLGSRGLEFSHEQLVLPENVTILPAKDSYLTAWRALDFLNPKAVLISGNYPRPNLVAALWAKYKLRNLYYLSDSNVLDTKNIDRGLINHFLLKRLLDATTKLLYIGQNNLNFYASICSKFSLKNKLDFFPLPHPCDAFELDIERSRDELIFLVLGRLVDVKGVDCVINALALLNQQDRRNCHLIIAGDGPTKSKLEKLVTQLDLVESVTFLGAVPSNQVHKIYSKADVVLVPSHEEPWGLVVNEALSSGRPVITPSWVGSCADLIIDYQTGIVMKDNLPSTIAAAMKYFIDYPMQAQVMGLNGRKLIRDGGWHVHRAVDAFGKILSEVG